jgi:hypothetical protein
VSFFRRARYATFLTILVVMVVGMGGMIIGWEVMDALFDPFFGVCAFALAFVLAPRLKHRLPF